MIRIAGALVLSVALTAGIVPAVKAAVNIGSGATKNMNCSAGLCSPTAKKAVLNTVDLANMLAASDVKVTTGSGAVTIEVTAAFSWASASRLTLDANYSVSIKAPVTLAGLGGVTIVTNDGGNGGDFLFFPGGKIDFWDLGSSLIVNGDSYTLARDIKTLASEIAANPAGAFALSADYDAHIDGHYIGSPIVTPFGGTFEGLGHTVSNLKMQNGSCLVSLGMFSAIQEGGTVRDLNLENAFASSKNPHVVGALAGISDGIVFNVSVSGSVHTVSGTAPHCRMVVGTAGGVVGESSESGRIINSRSSADVTGGYVTRRFPSNLGGLAGFGSNVEGSSASGNVSGIGGYIGGLVGAGDYIDRSFATGPVSAGGDYSSCNSSAGGLAGVAAHVTNSFATGSVYGNACAGGLVGGGGDIANSYAAGTVTGVCAGGFAAATSDVIRNAYSIGLVNNQGTGGGFIGCQSTGSYDADYWDLDTSEMAQGCGAGSCSGVTGLSDAQLKAALPAGFDPAIWGQKPSINNGYPYLLANPPPP